MSEDRKYFRDPIHGLIEVSGCALKIVQSSFFQRLRRIGQVGFTKLTYHGAEHSRFGHSLGAYHLAKQISGRLLQQEDENTVEEFCLAALLHDIGHHPLSHAFESALISNLDDGTNLGHENFTKAIIKNTIVGDTIDSSGLNKKNVIDLIEGRYLENADLTYLSNLISSELDVDRLDYLPRDAFYCGVHYGKLDLDRILIALEPQNGEIIVSEKGRQSIEMFVLARFFMYTQVYLHHTTRAFDIMLKKIFSKDIMKSIGYPKPEKDDIERFVNYDDFWLRGQIIHISQKSGSLESTLAKNVLKRDPLRWVVQKTAFADAQTLKTDPDYPIVVNLENDLEDIAQRAGVDVAKICFDTPWKDLPFENRYRPYSSSEDTEAIKVASKGQISDIAMDPTSLCFYLAKHIAQIIRVYTLQKHRIDVAQAITKKYANLKQYVWKR